MSSSRAITLLLLVFGLLVGVARGDSNIYGIPGECQLEVLECSTAAVDSTRPAPRVLSSVFMEDRWTVRGYEPSPDGKTLLVPLEDGIRLVRDGRSDDYRLDLPLGQRDPVWLPDSQRVALWVRVMRPGRPGAREVPVRALALLDLGRLPAGKALAPDQPAPYDVVHSCPPNSSPFGLVVAPDGQALLVLSADIDPDTNELFGAVTRVDLGPPTKSLEVLRTPGGLDFAWPRAGAAPEASRALLVGHADGVFVTDARGQRVERLPDLPSAGIFNLAWSPDRSRNQLLVFYRRPTKAASGALYQGVYLLDVEGALGQPAKPLVQLCDLRDVHSLWFSPRGTYATWANQRAVWFLTPGAEPSAAVQVTIPSLPNGDDPLIKGVAWSADETRLAITAGNKLYIHELATKALHVVAERGTMDDTFLAQPTWRGDSVLVSSYEDVSRTGRKVPGRR